MLGACDSSVECHVDCCCVCPVCTMFLLCSHFLVLCVFDGSPPFGPAQLVLSLPPRRNNAKALQICLVENYRGKGVVMVVGETSGARSGRIVPGRDLTGSEIKENIFEQITVVSCTGNEAKAAGRGSLLQLPCFYHPTPHFFREGDESRTRAANPAVHIQGQRGVGS